MKLQQELRTCSGEIKGDGPKLVKLKRWVNRSSDKLDISEYILKNKVKRTE